MRQSRRRRGPMRRSRKVDGFAVPAMTDRVATLGFCVDDLLPKARGGGVLKMGLAKLAEAEWLQPDPDLAARAHGFAAFPEGIQLAAEGDAAGAELAAMLGVSGGLPEAALRITKTCACSPCAGTRNNTASSGRRWHGRRTGCRPRRSACRCARSMRRSRAMRNSSRAGSIISWPSSSQAPIYGRCNWFIAATGEWRWVRRAARARLRPCHAGQCRRDAVRAFRAPDAAPPARHGRDPVHHRGLYRAAGPIGAREYRPTCHRRDRASRGRGRPAWCRGLRSGANRLCGSARAGDRGLMFKKILIANRGEIACRVIKTARAWESRRSRSIPMPMPARRSCSMADEAVHIGPAQAAESYLVADKIIAACKQTGADAVHPGYGFLSERASFVEALDERGHRLHRPAGHGDRRDGRQDREQEDRQRSGGERRCPVPSGRSPIPAEALEWANRDRLSGDDEGQRGRRRQGHAARLERTGRAAKASRRPSAKVSIPSATTASSSRNSSRIRATSRSRSSATSTAI